MKNQERGLGIEEREIWGEESTDVSEAQGCLNPQSSLPDPASLKRVQWRCRRGLLELDIFLQPFVATQYVKLSEAEKLVFDELLDLPDNTFWDMLSGRQANDDADQAALLEKIKSL
jgi:antitoxin CptB